MVTNINYIVDTILLVVLRGMVLQSVFVRLCLINWTFNSATGARCLYNSCNLSLVNLLRGQS